MRIWSVSYIEELARLSGQGGYIVHSLLEEHASADIESSGLSLKCVLSGTEDYQIGRRVHKVHSGQFLLVPPDYDVHASACLKETEGICFYIQGNTLKHWSGAVDQEFAVNLDEIMHQLVYVNDLMSDNPVGNLFKLTKQHIVGDHAANELRMFGEFELVNALVELYNNTAQCVAAKLSDIKKQSTRLEIHRRMMIVKDYIHARYDQPLDLARLANVACMSPYHFSRYFKECVGQPPVTYLNDVRLNQARLLLENSHVASITDAALAVGFCDHAHFSKSFKKQFGQPPKHFLHA